MMSQRSGVSARPKVYHTDPALKLNPTEEQWNAIVMENFEKHNQDKRDTIKYAFGKSKKIQEEQCVQIKNR